MAAANKYLGQSIASEHGFSVAAYEHRQLGFLVDVDVVKASAQWSRFGKKSPLSEEWEAVL